MAMFIKLARGSDVEVQLGNALPNNVVNDLQNVTAVQASDKELEAKFIDAALAKAKNGKMTLNVTPMKISV
jgi:hypothetical protein